MARLPQPGSDNGTWGDILNDYLAQALKPDGTIKDNAVTASAIAPDSISSASIADGTINEALLDTNVQTKLNNVGSGGVSDGTITTAKLQDGAVTDIKVSASAAIAKSKLAPLAIDDTDVNAISQSKVTNLVSDLAGKAASSHTHTATQISDSTSTGRSVVTAADAAAARTAIGAGTSSLAIGVTGSTAAAGNDSRLSDMRTPTDNTVTSAKIVDGNVTLAKLSSGVQSTLAAVNPANATYYVDNYGSDPTGAAFSDTAVGAAFTAMGSNPGIIVFGVGTYKLANSYHVENDQSVIGAGRALTKINYTGSGVFFSAYKTSFMSVASTARFGGRFDGFTIDGTSAGASAVGFQYGGLSSSRISNIQIQNFTGASAVGFKPYSPEGWVERTICDMTLINNTVNVLFDGRGAESTSFGYSSYRFNVTANANQVAWRLINGAILYSSKLEFLGNMNTGATNTGIVLDIQDTSQIYFNTGFQLSVESAGTSVAHQTVAIGSSAYIRGTSGHMTFFPGNGIDFVPMSIATKNQILFNGFVSGDSTYGKSGFSQAATIRGGITQWQGTMSSGVIYADTGNMFAQTLPNTSQTITFGSETANMVKQVLTLDIFLTQPSSGAACVVTWPAGITWESGSAPTLSVVNSGLDHIRLMGTMTNGTTGAGLRGVHVNGAATVVSTSITDSTAVGRSVLTAASATAARSAISAITATDVLGTVASGIKGGTKAIMSRRDLPRNVDQPWVTSIDGTITETVTTNSSTTTIASATGSAFLPSNRLTTIGGSTLHADGSQGSSYKFDWQYNDAAGYPAVNSYPNPKSWAVQFDVIGATEIEFLGYMRTNAAWNIMIDGKFVYDVPRTTAVTLNAQNLIKFTLPDSGMHRVRFYMNNISLRTIFATVGATLFKRPFRGPRVFFLGDSLTQGAGMSTGANVGGWIWRFSEMCGFEDIWNGGIGSTGPIATNSGNSANYQTRATTDVIPAAPDIVFISSYYNDLASGTTNVANAFGTTIDTIQASLPNTMIIVTGTYDPTGAATTQDAMATAVQAACTARNVPYIEPRTGAVYDGAGNQVYVTGAWINSANKSLMIGGDNVHQTDAGQKYQAYLMYNALRALLPA
jgi:hypothetical protein